MNLNHVIFAIFVLLIVLSYVKNFLIYYPHKVTLYKYASFHDRVKKLVEVEDYVISAFVKTTDNIFLDTLYVKNPDSDKCIIFFHGNAGNLTMRYDMINFLYTYASVLIFDYRSYGRSDGYVIFSSDVSMQTDSDAIWSYCVNVLKYSPSKISLFGESLGCAAALKLSAELCKSFESDSYPHSVVLNAPFYSLGSMIRVIFEKLRMGFVGNFFSMIYGSEYKSDMLIQCINPQVKIIIAHSLHDEIIPYAEGFKLYKLVSDTHPNIKFINISGSHNNLYLTDAYIYALSAAYE